MTYAQKLIILYISHNIVKKNYPFEEANNKNSLLFYVSFLVNLYNKIVVICYFVSHLYLNIPVRQNNPQIHPTYSHAGNAL